MSLLRDTTDEVWRLFRLFSCGCAWGTPFMLVALVNANPGVSSHPRLASALEAYLWPLILAAAFASLLGIAVVAWLTRKEREATVATLIAILVALAAGAIAAVPFASSNVYAFMAPLFLMFATILVGVVATTVVLARRIGWFALIWLVIWAIVTGLMWLGGTRTAAGGDDLGAGLMMLLAGGLVVGASLLGSLVGFILPRIVMNFSKQRVESDALDSTIELALRADGQER